MAEAEPGRPVATELDQGGLQPGRSLLPYSGPRLALCGFQSFSAGCWHAGTATTHLAPVPGQAAQWPTLLEVVLAARDNRAHPPPSATTSSSCREGRRRTTGALPSAAAPPPNPRPTFPSIPAPDATDPILLGHAGQMPSIAQQMADARAAGQTLPILRPGPRQAVPLEVAGREVLRVHGITPALSMAARPVSCIG